MFTRADGGFKVISSSYTSYDDEEISTLWTTLRICERRGYYIDTVNRVDLDANVTKNSQPLRCGKGMGLDAK